MGERKIEINKIAVVGMGYVGLPLAITFSEQEFNVIGFDINEEKIFKFNCSSSDVIQCCNVCCTG